MGRQWRRDCTKWLEGTGVYYWNITRAIHIGELQIKEPTEEDVKKYVAEKYKDGVRVVPWVMPEPIQDPSVQA